MSNIFANMFSGNKQAAQEPKPVQDPGNGNGGQQQQPTQQQKQNSAEPAFHQSKNQDPKQVDQTSKEGDTFSMADLEKLFETEKDDKGNPVQKETDDNADFFTYDPEALRTGVKKMNFTSGEEFQSLASEALKGDMEAFGQVLNMVAQNAVAQSAELSAGITNRAAKSSYDRAMKKLPESVRSLAATDNLSGINPKYMSKGLAPFTKTMKERVEQKYPDASSAEIAKLVNEYMSTAVKELQGGDSNDPTRRPDRDPNHQDQQPQNFANFFQG